MSSPCPCVHERTNGYRPCLNHRQYAKMQKRQEWLPSGPAPDISAHADEPAPVAEEDSDSSDDDVPDTSQLLTFAKTMLRAADEQVHRDQCVRAVFGVPDPEPEPEPEDFLPARPTKTAWKALSPQDRVLPIWSSAYVTQPLSRKQREKEPWNKHDWVSSMRDECKKMFKTYEALAFPVTWDELPKDALLAEMLTVTAVKNADLPFDLQQAKTRIVYGGHWITDVFGTVVDKREHPAVPGVTRLGTTSPFEVRCALAWAMIADTMTFPQKEPTLASFDVTSAYLQASTNNQPYYVTTNDPMLLDAIRAEKGWNWDFKGRPYFKLQKAMYGHPLAGDFWGWEFRTMIEEIGWRTHETDDEKTIYVHRGEGVDPDDESAPVVATLVIYVDDGFLVSFDDKITKRTRELLDEQWNCREWNVWEKSKTQRFLAGDHRYLSGNPRSIVTVGMKSYKEHAAARYEEDGGKLLPTVPKTMMSTSDESADDSLYAADCPLVQEEGPAPSLLFEDQDPLDVSHLRARTGEDSEYRWLLREAAEAWAETVDDETLMYYASGGVGSRYTDPVEEVAAALAADGEGSLSYAIGPDKAARHVGILSYAAMNSVPEISYAVQWLARRTTKWTPECEQRLRRLETYLKGHASDVLCLVGHRADKLTLLCEEDSDFAGDATRRSTTGYVIKLVGEKGSHVLLEWKSQLQKSISLSTAEAEIVAFRDALKKLVGMLDFVQVFFGSVKLVVNCDSSACLGIVMKGYSKALKHIRKLQDVSTKWVRETLETLCIEAQKVNSEDNSSDIMTKALDVTDTVHHLRFGLGIVDECHCAQPFFDRQCNGSPCRVFVSESARYGDLPCYCNGGRPRKKEFKRDYIYRAGHPLVSADEPPSVLQNDFSVAIDFAGVVTGSSVAAQRSVRAMLAAILV